MSGILLSGPAGAGKSQIAADLLAQATTPTVLADFQSIVVALLALERGPDGKYPVRPDWILPLAEYVRATTIRAAVERGFDVVATNSDGDELRRGYLLERLGPGAVERIIDPGREVVEERLALPDDEIDGDDLGEGRRLKSGRVLSGACRRAVDRWYGRRSGGRRR